MDMRYRLLLQQEADNFISCCFYGFDTANDLLTMLIDGIHREIRQHKHYK